MRTILFLLLSLLFVSFALAEPDCKDDICTNNISTNSTAAARGVIVVSAAFQRGHCINQLTVATASRPS
jgi:hypothetical protein